MPFELVPPDTSFDFIGKRHLCFLASLLVLLASAAAVPTRGIRMGIDLAGGTEMEVRFAEGAPVEEGAIREVARACGIADASVVRFGEPGSTDYVIRFRDGAASAAVPADGRCPLSAVNLKQLAALELASVGADGPNALIERLKLALRNRLGALTIERVGFVGASVRSDLRRAALRSLGLAALLIVLYVGFRFGPRFAPGAVIALLHDVAITAGIFVIAGWQFDLTVLAALLTIMGYGLNDTIVIYDRIRENLSSHTQHDLTDVLNRSVNQTLSRTLLTGGTTLFACIALMIVGGPVLRPFAIALAIGIVVGTLSSIYVAAPILLWLEQRTQTARA